MGQLEWIYDFEGYPLCGAKGKGLHLAKRRPANILSLVSNTYNSNNVYFVNRTSLLYIHVGLSQNM